VKPFAFALVLASVAICSVRGEEIKKRRFGIYMPKLDVYTQTSDVTDRIVAYQRTTPPGEIPLAEFPIVSEEDLVSYDWETHTLELRDRIWFTIRQPSMHGLPFVVVVDSKPIYVGAFWSNFSSIPSHVPTIVWDNERKSKQLTIERAQPPSSAKGMTLARTRN
jgi:hypothetical protein